MTVSQQGSIARICHQANKAYCESIGDGSQRDWADAPEWQRESALNGVEFVQANPGAPASASHENWLKEKLFAGWQHGAVKDPEKKLHPCVLSFEELPAEQQLKDVLFQAIVKALS